MKKLFLTLFLALTLSGCSTLKPSPIVPSVVVEYKYVSAPIPDEFLVIPAKVEPIRDWSQATQKTIAEWITKSELRTQDMESKLKLLKKNQDEQVKKQEITK